MPPGPAQRQGPLAGLRVVELGGIGPVPFCGMVLADLGAEVVRINRPAEVGGPVFSPVLDRGRRNLAVDLKSPAGVEAVRRLLDTADAVVEGFRPGVMERLGFVPDRLRSTNPRLVVGRMTGYGQDGPEAQTAGHDIDYIAMSGVLGAIGRPGERPSVPLNLVGDFGGGGMLLAVGVLAAMLSARTTGAGQDVDAAMVDGSALLMAMTYGFAAQGRWNLAERGVNLLDGGMPYYDTYECADGRYVAVGAVEPQFYAALVAGLELGEQLDLGAQFDVSTWPRQAALFTDCFRARNRDEWAAHFAGTDACVTAVLTPAEAPDAPHLKARSTYVTDTAGTIHPAPAPRFGGTPLAPPAPPAAPGSDTDALLAELGYRTEEIAALRGKGVVA